MSGKLCVTLLGHANQTVFEALVPEVGAAELVGYRATRQVRSCVAHASPNHTPRPAHPIGNGRRSERLFRQQKLIVGLEAIKRQTFTSTSPSTTTSVLPTNFSLGI